MGAVAVAPQSSLFCVVDAALVVPGGVVGRDGSDCSPGTANTHRPKAGLFFR